MTEPITTGWKQTGAIIGSLVGLATLWGLVVLPMTMDRVHAAIHSEIDKHAERPHAGAVDDGDWADMIRRLERIEDAVRD